MRNTKSQKIKLGIFVIIGVFFFVLAAYLIGNEQNLFSKTFRINAMFDNVKGLQIGNNVRYSGVNVGTVKKINMINDSTIIIDMAIDEKIINHIKKDAIATIGSDGLVGSMVVNIIPSDGIEPIVQSGDTIKSYSRVGTDDMLSTLNVTNKNAAILTTDLLKITQAINNSKGTVGMLINDTKMAVDLKETIMNLKKASKDASLSITSLNKFASTMNNKNSVATILFNDSISGNQLKRVIINLENSSKQIDQITNDLNSIVSEVKDGDGAINYLVTNKELVDDINETMKNVKEGTSRFNESMEALKQNFLFRKYFKNKEKEEIKEEESNKKTRI